jgi:hypothetical protein
MKGYFALFFIVQFCFCFPNSLSNVDNMIKCGKNLFSFLNRIDAIQKEISLAYDLKFIIDLARDLITNGLNSLDKCNNNYFLVISAELEILNDFLKNVDPYDSNLEKENLYSLTEIINKISITCKDIFKNTAGLLLKESVQINNSEIIRSNKIEEVLGCINNIILFSTYFDYLQTSRGDDFIVIVNKTYSNANLTHKMCNHLTISDNEKNSFKQCFKHIKKVGDLSQHLKNFSTKEFSLILPYLIEYCDEGESLVKVCREFINELETHFMNILTDKDDINNLM